MYTCSPTSLKDCILSSSRLFFPSLISLSSLPLFSFYISPMFGILPDYTQSCTGSFQTPSNLLSLWLAYVLLHLLGSLFPPQTFSLSDCFGTKRKLYESNLSLFEQCFSVNGAEMLFQKNNESEIKNASLASTLWPMGSHLWHYQGPALIVWYKKTHTKTSKWPSPPCNQKV